MLVENGHDYNHMSAIIGNRKMKILMALTQEDGQKIK